MYSIPLMVMYLLPVISLNVTTLETRTSNQTGMYVLCHETSNINPLSCRGEGNSAQI